ncbi:MAG: glycosyltransferase family 2 protein [Verrucomicrobia bacterium]|nr:glycosyltransferase family 2 protein [Verrucomicrobiota bacterium]
MTLLFVVMLSALALMVYAWLIFPVLISWCAVRQARPEAPRQPETFKPPLVDVVIAAHNEAAHIAKRIQNLLALDYPQDRLRVLIGVDGSDDDTARIAQAAADGHAGIHVHEFLVRRGKVPVLKDLVSLCEAPVIVFSDANTVFRRDALQRLVHPLSEAAVGAVCGKLVLAEDETAESGSGSEEGFYWDWETRLKVSESRLDSCLGANGAIFAIRRELFWSGLPVNTLVDDFVIGMKVREQGCRVLYEPRAVAFEELPELKDEWVRRVRIGAGDFQALGYCRGCLHPRFGWFALSFLSHKVLRWFTPHLGLLATLCGAVLAFAEDPLYRAGGVVVLAAAFCAVGVAGIGRALGRNESRYARLPRLGWHFVSMQLALLMGSVKFCRGNMGSHWTRTPRTADRD